MIDIPADSIPIQPIVGTGQIDVYIVASREMPNGIGTERLATVPLNYQFTNDAKQVSLFTTKVHKSQLGGIVDGRADGELAENELVGRVSNGKGKLKEVRHTKDNEKKNSSNDKVE